MNIVRDEDCHQEGVTDDRKCDSPKRGVKGIREVSQLRERCDGYEVGIRRCDQQLGGGCVYPSVSL